MGGKGARGGRVRGEGGEEDLICFNSYHKEMNSQGLNTSKPQNRIFLCA